jgi:hypothetical protein
MVRRSVGDSDHRVATIRRIDEAADEALDGSEEWVEVEFLSLLVVSYRLLAIRCGLGESPHLWPKMGDRSQSHNGQQLHRKLVQDRFLPPLRLIYASIEEARRKHRGTTEQLARIFHGRRGRERSGLKQNRVFSELLWRRRITGTPGRPPTACDPGASGVRTRSSGIAWAGASGNGRPQLWTDCTTCWQ